MKTRKFYSLEKILPKSFENMLENPVILVPLGSIEWHGSHMPLGTDGIKAYEICRLVAEKIGCLVTPPIYYGYCHQMLSKHGTISVPMEELEYTIKGVIKALHDAGFKIILLFCGHYEIEYFNLINDIASRMNREFDSLKIIVKTEQDFIEKHGYKADHGGPFETSQLLYLTPSLVDLSKIREEDNIVPDPRCSSRELGEKIVKVIVKGLSQFLIDLLEER